MPPRGLPGDANLEQLKKGAKAFQRAVRAGDPGAAEVVCEFHPRSPDLTTFKLADAQLVVARSFDFPSWPKLKSYLELVQEYARSPHHEPTGGTHAGEHSLADEFLRLACLTYGGDDPARWAKARELLDAHPELARANIHTMAAIGEVAGARELLARDPSQAGAQGGPHRWEPLLYLTYSRLGVTAPDRSPLEAARLLLDHGADPNAGYLWEGLSPPFTALTGAFGSGEGDPPAHPQGMALARLLLERGAEPNDAQTLYNRHWDSDAAWLELLFEFGLGTGAGGRWHRLLVPAHPTPRKMLEEQLMSAAHHGFTDHVRLLLAHGVDPDAPAATHPMYERRRPVQEAAVWGHPEIVALLADAGASAGIDDVHSFVSAATTGDRARVEEILDADPALRERALARYPDQLVRAAEGNNVDAVKLLIDLGFDVNAINRTAPLHEAAMRGN
ncbi:MAG TPA: ankyrin repeat domain-containing protein, partial [Solirubrobacteraceae bacterium]|nr:ankyrin repeat domain-containing protein [Solirubrobacteraceae bacterium]